MRCPVPQAIRQGYMVSRRGGAGGGMGLACSVSMLQPLVSISLAFIKVYVASWLGSPGSTPPPLP